MKQVIVVRSDLKMGKGKLAVQVAHASLEAYKRSEKEKIKAWEWEGSKKIVVKVGSLEELLDLKKRAEELKIPNALVMDAGLTQLEKGTITCLALGPAEDEKIDELTGKLKLV